MILSNTILRFIFKNWGKFIENKQFWKGWLNMSWKYFNIIYLIFRRFFIIKKAHILPVYFIMKNSDFWKEIILHFWINLILHLWFSSDIPTYDTNLPSFKTSYRMNGTSNHRAFKWFEILRLFYCIFPSS